MVSMVRIASSAPTALAESLRRCGFDDALERAAVLGAAFRGLLVDRFATGDVSRTDAAAAALSECVAAR